MDVLQPIAGIPLLVASSLKIAVMFGVVMLTVAYTTLAERRVSAFIQDRMGPNRVGPFGLLQPIADGLKSLVKEETLPASSSKLYFMLGPMLAMVPALVTFAVVPFAAPLPTPWGVVDMIIADVPIGILYILALSSLGVYGIVISGWASNNKYAFLGALRASAQMVSYEVPLGLSLIVVLMLAGNVTLTEIVWQQQQLDLWYVLPLSLGFILFVIAAFAETNRLPFDMPEAESELITGFHTEYSAMKFSHVLHCRVLPHVDGLSPHGHPLLRGVGPPGDLGRTPFGTEALWSAGSARTAHPSQRYRPYGKRSSPSRLLRPRRRSFSCCTSGSAGRWPRFRYDQVMQLGWKVLLPTALAYVMVMAGTMLILDQVGVTYGFTYGLALTAVSTVCTVAFVFYLDRGRIIGGAAAGRVRVLEEASASGDLECTVDHPP